MNERFFFQNEENIVCLPNTCSLFGGNETWGFDMETVGGGIGLFIGTTLLPDNTSPGLRGFGLGGRAGGAPPLTPERFVGCIVGIGLRRLDTHDAILDGKGFLPSTMRDVDAD